MTCRCRWVYDKDVPGGKFLVPGCMNRAVHGDDADCHCPDDPETVEDRIAAMEAKIAELQTAVAVLRGPR
jgi:hypothetical protein